MNRLFLINNNRAPTREEISNVDSFVGETLFAGYDLEYAGYITVKDDMKLAAQWIIPDYSLNDICSQVGQTKVPGYTIKVFTSVTKNDGTVISQQLA